VQVLEDGQEKGQLPVQSSRRRKAELEKRQNSPLMRQQSQLVVGEQTRVDLRLIGEDVETGRAELTALESSEKGLLVDDSSASGVDEHATLLHGAELLLAEEAASVGVEREVEGDDVRGGEELVESRDVGNGAFGLKPSKKSQLTVHDDGAIER
jgi:hypothetical protein